MFLNLTEDAEVLFVFFKIPVPEMWWLISSVPGCGPVFESGISHHGKKSEDRQGHCTVHIYRTVNSLVREGILHLKLKKKNRIISVDYFTYVTQD